MYLLVDVYDLFRFLKNLMVFECGDKIYIIRKFIYQESFIFRLFLKALNNL